MWHLPAHFTPTPAKLRVDHRRTRGCVRHLAFGVKRTNGRTFFVYSFIGVSFHHSTKL